MKDIQNEIGDASLQPYPFTSKQMTWMGEWRILFDFTTDKNIEYTAALLENYPPDKKEYEFTFYPKGGNFKDIVNKGELFKVMSTIVAILKDGINQLNDRGGWNKIKFSPSKSFKGDERRANLYQSYISKNLPSNIKVSGGTNKVTFTNLNQSQLKEMKDIQKIKEFFSKPLNEGNKEYFKPSIRKDKSNPNFLYIDIAYPAGSDVLSVGGSKTMGGQDREEGATKALSMGNNIAKKLESKYNIEDIEVKDLKNGKVQVFAVSDDFIKMASPSLADAEEETPVDMAKKQLDALGVKYEMSGNKFRPFKAIYRPNNKPESFYKEFNRIVYEFNLGSAVEQAMNEANGFKSGKEFINIKLQKYPKAIAKINQLISMVGESNFTMEMAEWIFDFFNNASYESPVNEAKEEDKVDTITMDVPLFIRMLEYSREDAAEDMDLHDVTEKAISLGKERGILQMDDYDEIIGTTEKVNEVNLKQSKLSSAEYQKAKKLKDFKASDWKWNADEDLYTKVNEGELTEAFVPSNIKEFAKRKGVSSLVNKVAGWAEKVGKGIRGGTAIGMNYSTLILDMTHQGSEIRINTNNDTVELYDEPVRSFDEFKQVYLDNQDESDNGLEERINEALNKINEELCPAGKAYIKRRQAAGEKSSAYLSGRGVKVCKGQMLGKSKKKK
jgi:hypothetical protein